MKPRKGQGPIRICNGNTIHARRPPCFRVFFWVLFTSLPGIGHSQEAIFSDASDLGVDFVHFNGMSGEFYIPEEVGSGCALFDYDGDGDLDLYLVQGTILGQGKTLSQMIFKPAHPLPLVDRLYRNDLTIQPDGSRRLKFTDVTKASGLHADGYGMGVAIADVDNDGDLDLYVTNFGPNQMWRNNGDGSFTNMTDTSGTGNGSWGASASFADYDRDGWADLYVTNYLRYDLKHAKDCRLPSGQRDYCGPNSQPDAQDRLFRNLGGGRFADVTLPSGVHAERGSGLGVIALDLNGDSWLDFYVANDADANLLWLNRKDGTFINDALLAGVALNGNGAPEAGMGVDAGDVDGDGDEDLFLSHMASETNTLYRNEGEGFFDDITGTSGLGTPSLRATGFGTRFFDYDNDGWLDLLVANGLVQSDPQLLQKGDPYPLHQPNQLFRNQQGKGFAEITDQAGPAFQRSEVSRGSAFGDLDNDGDTDVVIANNSGPVRILINQIGNRNPWLGIEVVSKTNRDLTGTMVSLIRDGKPNLTRRVHRDGSFASSSDPRILFGLGHNPKVAQVVILWPNGKRQTLEKPAINRYHRVAP